MASATTLVPLETYLSTSYEHDCEWVDGELRERGTPDDYHSAIQVFLVGFFLSIRAELAVRVVSERRTKVAARSYRIPDVALFSVDAPFGSVVTDPPLLCVEILSPDDRASELQEKIAEYLAMGVPAIWVIDPRRKTMATADAQGIHFVEELGLAGTGVRLRGSELFAEIEFYERRDGKAKID